MKFVVFEKCVVNVEMVTHLTPYGTDRTYIHFSAAGDAGLAVKGTMHDVLNKLQGTSDE